MSEYDLYEHPGEMTDEDIALLPGDDPMPDQDTEQFPNEPVFWKLLPSPVIAGIRTITPYVVGWVISFLAWLFSVLGLDMSLSEPASLWLSNILPLVFGSLYYLLALNFLEKKFPSVPWLGVNKPPIYTDAKPEEAKEIAQFATLTAPYVWVHGKKACSCLRTVTPLVEARLRALGVITKDLSGLITQGSYNTSVSASGSTHSGGGVWDVKWNLVNTDAKKIAWLESGIIPFDRQTKDAPKSRWPNHGHVVVMGCPHLSRSAAAQVKSALNGRNALLNNGKFRGPLGYFRTWRQAVADAKKNEISQTATITQDYAKLIPRVWTPKPWPKIAEDGILGAQTMDRLRMQLNLKPTGEKEFSHWDVAAFLLWVNQPYLGTGVLTTAAVTAAQGRFGINRTGKWDRTFTLALQKYLNKHR